MGEVEGGGQLVVVVVLVGEDGAAAAVVTLVVVVVHEGKGAQAVQQVLPRNGTDQDELWILCDYIGNGRMLRIMA